MVDGNGRGAGEGLAQQGDLADRGLTRDRRLGCGLQSRRVLGQILKQHCRPADEVAAVPQIARGDIGPGRLEIGFFHEGGHGLHAIVGGLRTDIAEGRGRMGRLEPERQDRALQGGADRRSDCVTEGGVIDDMMVGRDEHRHRSGKAGFDPDAGRRDSRTRVSRARLQQQKRPCADFGQLIFDKRAVVLVGHH